jgi:ABC-type multidrug transport system fused ATPase/permease subunit
MKRFSRLLPYYRPYRFLLWSDILAVFIVSLLSMTIPYILKILVDDAIMGETSPSSSDLRCAWPRPVWSRGPLDITRSTRATSWPSV